MDGTPWKSFWHKYMLFVHLMSPPQRLLFSNISTEHYDFILHYGIKWQPKVHLSNGSIVKRPFLYGTSPVVLPTATRLEERLSGAAEKASSQCEHTRYIVMRFVGDPFSGFCNNRGY